MRVQEGSLRPSTNVMGGYIHRIGNRPEITVVQYQPKPKKTSNIDWERVQKRFKDELGDESKYWPLAERLGIDGIALKLLDVGWSNDHHAWTYPMKDETGKIIGIRLRNDEGRKWAVTGSHSGLFYANVVNPNTAVIAEGPTDTAAGYSLGYFTIGRPSCNSCVDMTVKLLKIKQVRRVIIVADNDKPGLDGAAVLQHAINGIKTVIWVPPVKDLRDFVFQKGTRAEMDSLTRALVWA